MHRWTLASGARHTAHIIALVSMGCGSDPIVSRNVDTPVGHTTTYGAPHDTTYSVRAEPAQDRLRLIVREQSQCDLLRMQVVQRVVETVKGDEVLNRSPAQNVQVAEGRQGVAPCNERFVRNQTVSLQVGSAVYPLGKPDKRGVLWIDLSETLRQGLYGKSDSGPDQATVLVDGVPAGTISLGPLKQHGARIEELLGEFRTLLEHEQTELSPKDIARSYEVYAQLVAIAPDDPRVLALETRFLELVYGRRQVESTENLKRNLEALSKAKDLIAGADTVIFPPYLRAAILDGNPTPQSLQWARRTAALGLRQHRGLCNGPNTSFAWAAIDSTGVSLESRVALNFLRFAYNDPYADTLSRICRGLY